MNKKILNIEETFTLAVQNHKKNNLMAAEKLYNEILKKNPNYVGAYNNLGILYNQYGNNQKAAHYYKKAIQINPNHFDAHNNLGILYNQYGNFKKAVHCYEKAIQINHNHVDAHNNLGNIFKKIGKNQKAIDYYEKAIQINPNHIDANNNLGALFNELGKHQKAKNCYEKVIKMDPDNLTSHWLAMNNFPVIYKSLEEIDHYRKKFENSIKKINKLIDIQSHFTRQQFINAISSSTNFYLHYQGKDILELQKDYASLIERITQKTHQEFHKEKKKYFIKTF